MKKKAKKEINLYDGKFLGFIESYHVPLKKIVKNICRTKHWEKATYAHLSTFYHAKKHGIKNFWNIDADDTLICASVEKTAEILLSAQKYAHENNIDAFSLDMHDSENYGNWTWGITYVQSRLDWWKIFTENKNKKWQEKYLDTEVCFNSDNFMNYLKDEKIANNKSFYVNGLYFSHLANLCAWLRGLALYKWHDNVLTFPLMNSINNNELTSPIGENVVRLDVPIDNAVEYVENMFFHMDFIRKNRERWLQKCKC